MTMKTKSSEKFTISYNSTNSFITSNRFFFKLFYKVGLRKVKMN